MATRSKYQKGTTTIHRSPYKINGRQSLLKYIDEHLDKHSLIILPKYVYNYICSTRSLLGRMYCSQVDNLIKENAKPDGFFRLHLLFNDFGGFLCLKFIIFSLEFSRYHKHFHRLYYKNWLQSLAVVRVLQTYTYFG